MDVEQQLKDAVQRAAVAESALATARLDERRSRELFEAGLAARRDYEAAQIRIAEREGQVAGAKAWVVKPFKPEQMLSAVQRLCLP